MPEENDYQIFYDTIFKSFCDDVKKFNNVDEYRKLIIKNQARLDGDAAVYIEIINKLINNFPLSGIVPPKARQQQILNDCVIIELYSMYLINDINKQLSDETLATFLSLLKAWMIAVTYSSAKQNDIEFYLSTTDTVLQYFDKLPFDLSDDINFYINILRRYYNLARHNTKFRAKEKFFKTYNESASLEMKYFKKKKGVEYLTSLTNYLSISIDHLFVNINLDDTYITLNDIESHYNTLKEKFEDYLVQETPDNIVMYRICSIFFKYRLYTLKLTIKNKKPPTENDKASLLKQCSLLIKMFYDQLSNTDDITPVFIAPGKYLYKDELSVFSKQLFILLNDAENNVSEPLYLVFQFLSNFKEYLKLNLNIYKKLSALTKTFYDRKIYLLSSTIYLKSISNMDLLKKEILKIKASIETNPIISLISLYNHEIESIYELDTNLKNQYKIDPYIIDIIDKITEIKHLVFNKLDKIKLMLSKKDENIERVRKISLHENELKNVFVIVKDPNLLRNLNQFYIFFLESYIKTINMEHREDFNSKIISIKASLLNINPLNLAVALVYIKLLHLFQMTYEGTIPASRIIKNLGTSYEKINNEFNLSDIDGINWTSIIAIIQNNQEAVVIKNIYNFLPTSNLLRILVLIIDNITAEGSIGLPFFEELYDKSFIPARREWGIDPIMIYYINTYLSKKGKMLFTSCVYGGSLTIVFPMYKNNRIQQKINTFFHDVFKGAPTVDFNYLNELKEFSRQQDNKNSLLEDDDKKKHISLHTIEYFINNNKSSYLSRPYMSDTDIIYISDVLNHYLTFLGKSKIINAVKYIMKELISNANKANLKRAHFNLKNKDINKRYKFGIGDFIFEIKKRFMEYINVIKEKKLLVTVEFYVFDRNFIISVTNNYRISDDESKLIDERFSLAKTFKDMKEIYSTNLNTKEGKGLGIIMIIHFLKKLGLGGECFKVNITNTETAFKIILPAHIINHDKGSLISQELINGVNYVPMIPDNIRRLQEKIANPNSSMEEIEKLILHDAGLSANILMRANSAFYARSSHIDHIKDAITRIGLKALNNIVTIYSSYNLLKDKAADKRIQEIIIHSERTAFYAREIIRLKKVDVNIDDIYLGTLLHDIGKILVEASYPDIYQKIQDIIEDRSIPVDIIEDLLGGLYHSTTGALLAEKWRFPKFVHDAIKYHHSPRNTEEYFTETFLIYLANTFTYYNDNQILFENFDHNVLEFFELSKKEQIDELGQILKAKEALYKEKFSY